MCRFISLVILGFIMLICAIPKHWEFEPTDFMAIIVSLLSFFFAYLVYDRGIVKNAPEEHFNENNNGIYSISSSHMGKTYKLSIDVDSQLITLLSEGKEKTYHFSEITSFEYNIASLRNVRLPFSTLNYVDTYYSFKTTDLAAPVWYLKFVAKGNLDNPKCYKDTVALYEKWHQIIHAIMNKNAR